MVRTAQLYIWVIMLGPCKDKKNIIEELVAKTDDDDIRQVISQYAPDKPANEIEQSLSEKGVTKDKMMKTIKFLHPDREVAETISKPQLIKETVFSIERLLPENCRYCNEVYATKHGIQLPLSSAITANREYMKTVPN